MTTEQLARFMAKVRQGEGCWEWIGYLHPSGYGYVNIDGQPSTAHRRLYEHVNGPVDRGMHVDHLCRNRACVRPDHLEAVTPHENSLRGMIATRSSCAAGHPYDENTYRHPNGDRRCRACKQGYDARYRAKAKGEE